jgi:sugar phosphate isomerase/epimerase
MKTCFHSVGLPARPILEAIDLVADAGYAAIEVNCETLPWAPPHATPATTAAERSAIRQACERRGLSIPAVGAHIGMVPADRADREAAIAFVNGCTDLAADLGSPVVHILSGPQAAEAGREEGWRWFADAVARTTAHATSRGIVMAVEAIAGHLFHKVDDYQSLFADLKGVPVMVNFDPSHLEVQGEDPRRVVDELGDRIVHVHLKDGKGIYPAFEFPPLGAGTIDFAALARGLSRAGYTGAMSVEYEAQVFGYRQSEAEILSHGMAFLKALDSGG